MPRSLTSAITGMVNNQLVLDVTANNLANVNTSGFKASRVSFSTTLVQTEFSGSAPGTSLGGTNPRQVGLGMTTGTIDMDMRQGSLQSTGRSLDLAVQGEGFFEVTDGTRSLYTRVGNFGFDSQDNLIDLGTGFKVVGNVYNSTPNPDGTQSLSTLNTQLNVPRSEAFPPKQTQEINFQGNLDSTTAALRGSALNSVYALSNAVTGNVATEATLLKDLTIFKGGVVAGSPVTMSVYGTKPNGEVYAGEFTIDPWTDSVGDLIDGMNGALVQGTERFGNVQINNGILTATGSGTATGFSLFFGESVAANNPIGAEPVYTALDNGSLNYTGTDVAGPAGGIDTVSAAGEIGLLRPVFHMPNTVNLAAQTGQIIRVTVLINGEERGSITIPAADYTAVGAQLDFELTSFPHVQMGDTIQYNFAGTLNMGAANLTWDTGIITDSASTNLTNDADLSGLPDMFDEGSSTDANAWSYLNDTNTTFDWYRMRLVPETVNTSLDVFDSAGTRHTVEARFFRNGTRVDGTGARINSWDCIVAPTFGESTIINDVVAGIEFDQNGKFLSTGSSVHATTYSDDDYVGNPGAGTIQLDWATTGTTDPATITMDFGEANTFGGLTSFGSTSTAAAVGQDGYTDGKLDSLSISAIGDVIGLYTNGVSRKLAQVPLATFRNVAGLTAVSANMFQESVNSGTVTRRTAGSGAGFISAGALESGNVDIATEFTRIIVAQRGFQVAARVIQTTDQLLEELANLKRG
jgi:flagellar hook protein FlgE